MGMFMPNGGIINNFGSIQGILFLEVSLTENWLIFVTRGGETWPSWQLIGAIFGVDALSTLFTVFGWLTGGRGEPSGPETVNRLLSTDGRTSIVTVAIVIAIVYYLMNRMAWLDNLGRAKRSRADTQM